MEDSEATVILEGLRSQVCVFGEVLQMLIEKLDRIYNKLDRT